MNDFQIPETVAFALNRLRAAGYHAYVVGGCVRDFLMDRAPGDYDVTTSAKPEQTLAVFSDCRMVETGLKHGTVTLVRGGMNVEITTYRVDGIYLDGRRPENVTFTDDLAEDLCRRDFTVNAMAYNPQSGVIDLHGGRKDLQNRVISCVGKAEKRFSEDGLRILRALRFSSVLDFTPDDECDAAMRTLAGLLDRISRERIYAELTKLLCGPAVARILRKYADIIVRILPGLTEDSVRKTADFIERAREIVKKAEIELDKDAMTSVYYALLFSQTDGNLCNTLMRSLKPSREELCAVKELRKYGDSDDWFTKQEFVYAVKLLIKAGDDPFPGKVAAYQYAVGMLDENAAARIVRTAEELRNAGACVRLAELQITGRDLMTLGLQGPNIGLALNELLDRVMRGELENSREILMKAARLM